MLAPLVNPYDSSMTKEEIYKTWENWTRRRRMLFYLARRFPKFLGHFYHRTFLSGKHGQLEKWLSLSLAKKVVSSLPSNVHPPNGEPVIEMYSYKLLRTKPCCKLVSLLVCLNKIFQLFSCRTRILLKHQLLKKYGTGMLRSRFAREI